MSSERRLTVALTGASGSIYGIRFLKAVAGVYDRIYLTVSDNASAVMKAELGADAPIDTSFLGEHAGKVRLLSPRDLAAPPSSGSVVTDGMVVIPCSMGTAGRIASGVSNDLVTRAADVCLKERRRLVLVVRETPLSVIHLRNLTTLAEAGATVLPATPAFYHNPRSIDDLVDFVVARVMQQLGLDQELVEEWSGGSQSGAADV